METRQTPALYLDISLENETQFVETIPQDYNSFLYVAEGSIVVTDGGASETVVPAGTVAVLGEGDSVHITGKDHQSRFLLIAGLVLNEPIARGGPFVMNTKAEVLQAFKDFQSGNF